MNIIKCDKSGDCSRFLGLFLALLLIIFTSSCLEGVNGQKSGNPMGTQQILVTVNPESVFGNACEFADLLALFNEALTPDGATIQVALTGSDLPFNLRGCITFFDPVVIDGMAEGEYLSPPLLGVGNLGFVNVAVTSTLQSGISASNFFPIAIQGVGIVSITGPDMITSDPDLFATIEVDTVGIPTGTVVSFQLTNNSCGSLFNPTTILGSVFQGVAIVQYDPDDGEVCTQTVIATIVLPDPPTKDPDCPSIPVEDRTIQASVTFDQVVPPPPTPTPTPSPTPTPGPTPTPTPGPSIDVMATNTIEPNSSTIVTATTMNAPPNTNVCCDISIQNNSDSFLTFMMMMSPPDAAVCGPTDTNGQYFSVLTGGDVGTLTTIQVECCIDSDTTPNACDPGEPLGTVLVDINPEGVPPPIELSAQPAIISPGGQSAITASTTPPVFPGEICFEIVLGAADTSLFNDMSGVDFLCADTTSLGQAVVGLMDDSGAMTQRFATVKGCINENPGDGMCNPSDPSNVVTVTIAPPAPTPTPVPTPTPPLGMTISSTNLSPSAGGNTIIDVVTNPSASNCVFFVVNSTTASTLQTINPLGATSTMEACGMAVSGQNSYRLNVDGTASGEQIRVQGCIDTMVTGCADDQDKLSNTLTFFIP